MNTVETLQGAGVATSPPADEPRPRRDHFGAIVAGTLFVVGGALWFLDVLGVIEVDPALILPALLVAIGLALVIGSTRGAHPGLIVAGALVAAAAMATALIPPGTFAGGLGPRVLTVTEQADLQPAYNLAVGDLRLDLGDLVMTEASSVAVSVGTGTLTVILPPEVAVDIDASAGAGEVELLGERADGISPSLAYTSEQFETESVTLTLDLNVAAGTIEVTR
jgi:hypothetical protein